ncbi:ATP-binding protein [Rhodoblastus acidophilus]|uniref:ATP-binding protein n=1 Tax=Candidatus Rhodoblastus alkanivorans TaxID=2954117 RepID=A0ABS9ZD92_9HYPH|nr:ATP-binding protein [Candidatus Rhodoblastus alkanivorans]MCI4677104.1 ATP-binding protein [Candidatus Rhodoblastus alkanivorans]MCI4684457.1 ATP-binding protein [Candidatus Rhodoblastus alkanivorans]MDI4641778.1 ATP-binding protein [Rhodoblastus acidophilus]
MKLHIARPYVEALAADFPELESLKAQLLFGDKVEIPFQQLSGAQVDRLHDLYGEAGPPMQSARAQLATLRDAFEGSGARFAADDLESVVPAIASFLIDGAQRGWLFAMNVGGRPLPYVVARIDYTPPSNDETGRIFVELKANSKGELTTVQVRIMAGDIAGRTVAEIFAGKGFLRETPELIAAYDANAENYFEWRAHYGAQFAGSGLGFFAEDPSSSHRSNDWTRKDTVILSSGGNPARLVNDESLLANRALTLELTGDIFGNYLRKAAKSNLYAEEDEVAAARANIGKDLFRQIPVHPFILMFHLDLHHYVWAHVEDIEPYVYQPDLKQKLVLPEEQTDLIDILTAEMDVLMDDIVAGKSGGTTVLCAGPPGVGKTLTAEVYSEIVKRPLYRVHSGQLGLNVAAMETSLKEALLRAQRWGAVMLIDEADVYIKRRQDDMTMNAVVGVFLRVLEYFNGLLFLTTNRIDDIDEAIVSRCIALIRFHSPDAEARTRIWKVMSEQFALSLDEKLISTLVEFYPQTSGRDIKGLAKLVSKYCRHRDTPPDLGVFKRCAIFRGLDQAAAS